MDFLSHLQNNPTFEFTVLVTTLIALVSLASFVHLNRLFKVKTQKRNKQLPLPPGPTPWPIVGNLPEMWRNKPAFSWIHGLMKELNTNISCIRLGNVHVIPVTSPEIALEVLRDNDAVFASRPLTMGT